ncbi:MAG TPA: carbon monoxide dehydrogenase subunit G [Usitatibacter sp.]|nr:carbon monoxide dehydrogenase subunit G [Usitatibacter sp.]
MELKGERLLPVDRAAAWEALNDPERLRAAIPGCEAMERTGDNEYRVQIATALGPVRAKFRGRLRVEDIVAPERYTLRFDGEGGAAGFAKGSAQVTLADEGASTRLAYAVAAQVGGKIAQVGSRLIDSAALKLADDFFASFERQLAPAAATAPHEETMLEEIESSFVLHDPRTWNWVAWVVFLAVVLVLAALLLR